MGSKGKLVTVAGDRQGQVLDYTLDLSWLASLQVTTQSYFASLLSTLD